MIKLKYHHIGIPTDKPLPENDYIPEYQLYASGYRTSDYGIEWMKFDPDCPVPEWLQTLPHGAFGVDDIRAAIAGKKVLIAPKRPSDGVTVAFIEDNGAPIELLQFDHPEAEIWSPEASFRDPQ